MTRKTGIWRAVSILIAASLAATFIPLALSALTSLPLDRAAHSGRVRAISPSNPPVSEWTSKISVEGSALVRGCPATIAARSAAGASGGTASPMQIGPYSCSISRWRSVQSGRGLYRSSTIAPVLACRSRGNGHGLNQATTSSGRSHCYCVQAWCWDDSGVLPLRLRTSRSTAQRTQLVRLHRA